MDKPDIFGEKIKKRHKEVLEIFEKIRCEKSSYHINEEAGTLEELLQQLLEKLLNLHNEYRLSRDKQSKLLENLKKLCEEGLSERNTKYIEEEWSEEMTAENDKIDLYFKMLFDLEDGVQLAKNKLNLLENQKGQLEIKEEINRIAKGYGLSLKEEHLDKLYTNVIKISDNLYSDFLTQFVSEDLELVSFLKILSLSNQNRLPLEISTTVKAKKKSVTLQNTHLIFQLMNFVGTFLDIEKGRIYEKKLKIPRKLRTQNNQDDSKYWIEFVKTEDAELYESYKERGGLFSTHSFPYTSEELDEIIKHEQDDIKLMKENIKLNLHIKLSSVVKYFRQEGVFNKNTKTIKTVEACFLYDTLVVCGKLEDDISVLRTDKYDFIKRRLAK